MENGMQKAIAEIYAFSQADSIVGREGNDLDAWELEYSKAYTERMIELDSLYSKPKTESLEELMNIVGTAMYKAGDLEVEVITEAFKYLTEVNPNATIKDALAYGLNEWIK